MSVAVFHYSFVCSSHTLTLLPSPTFLWCPHYPVSIIKYAGVSSTVNQCSYIGAMSILKPKKWINSKLACCWASLLSLSSLLSPLIHGTGLAGRREGKTHQVNSLFWKPTTRRGWNQGRQLRFTTFAVLYPSINTMKSFKISSLQRASQSYQHTLMLHILASLKRKKKKKSPKKGLPLSGTSLIVIILRISLCSVCSNKSSANTGLYRYVVFLQ